MVGFLILVCSVFAVVFGCEEPELSIDTVKYIPSFEEEVAASGRCTATEHKALFVINPWRNKTSVWCSCDVEISGGFCPEVNIGDKIRIQENYQAPCHNFSAQPCPQKYNASQSYKHRGCFEKFGGILSQKSLVIRKEWLEDTIQKLERRIYQCENFLSQRNNKIIENNKNIEFLQNEVRKQREEYSRMKGTYIGVVSVLCILIALICLYLNRRKVKHFFQQRFKKQCCCGVICDTSNNCKLIHICKKDQTSDSEENKSMLSPDETDNIIGQMASIQYENELIPTEAKDENGQIQTDESALVQTDEKYENASVQTDEKYENASVQTDGKYENASVQTDEKASVQTDEKASVQTDGKYENASVQADEKASIQTDEKYENASVQTDGKYENASVQTDENASVQTDEKASVQTDGKYENAFVQTDENASVQADEKASIQTDEKYENASVQTDGKYENTSVLTNAQDENESVPINVQDGYYDTGHIDVEDKNDTIHTDTAQGDLDNEMKLMDIVVDGES